MRRLEVQFLSPAPMFSTTDCAAWSPGKETPGSAVLTLVVKDRKMVDLRDLGSRGKRKVLSPISETIIRVRPMGFGRRRFIFLAVLNFGAGSTSDANHQG